MLIIPAIDLRKGRCVRLVQGNPKRETVYSQEPVSMARWWQLKGAKRLHLIDLDGAFCGKVQNMEVIKKIVKAVKMPVQVGGGIRDIETIEKMLKLGVKWVILGTSVWNDKEFLKKAVKKFKSKIIIAVDCKKGRVAVSGWKKITKVKAIDLIREIEALGVKTIIYTDIAKDGMLKGPNFRSIGNLLNSTKISVVASGGITVLKDLEKLKRLEKKGLTGAVIGKALYTGSIDLVSAMKVGS